MASDNKYVICPTPGADDDVWDHVVDRNRGKLSLDGSQIALTWPFDKHPHWAMVKRLAGVCYTHAEVLVVLAGPEWTAADAVVL